MEGATPTQYSTVFDLKNRQVHLYHFHNFEQVVTIDISAELLEGWHAVDLASLFPLTYASATYVSPLREPVTGVLLKTIADAGVENAIKKCEFLREFDAEHYDARPSPVLVAGLELMWAGKKATAIQWLRYAAELFPGEADAHTCLGEAYLTSGDRKNARLCFERAHQISPNIVTKARLAKLNDNIGD
jgi:tetratricopeptide (TPR) repeat protein